MKPFTIKLREFRKLPEASDYYLIPSEDMYKCFKLLVNSGKFAHHPHRWLLNTVELSGIGKFTDELLIKNTVLIDGKLSNNKIFNKSSAGKSRENKNGYYMCDSAVLSKYQSQINKFVIDEGAIQDTAEALFPEYKAEIHVGYKLGRIDLISKSTIVEIKKFLEWKHGLGQLLAYAHKHSDKRKILILYKAKINKKQLKEACTVCNSYNVHVETIEGEISANKWLQQTKLRYA